MDSLPAIKQLLTNGILFSKFSKSFVAVCVKVEQQARQKGHQINGDRTMASTSARR